MGNSESERKGRTLIQSLGLDGTPYEALANHKHLAHPAAMKPTSLKDIMQKGGRISRWIYESRRALV